MMTGKPVTSAWCLSSRRNSSSVLTLRTSGLAVAIPHSASTKTAKRSRPGIIAPHATLLKVVEGSPCKKTWRQAAKLPRQHRRSTVRERFEETVDLAA